MSQTDAVTDGSGDDHSAAGLETIVVDPDDVVETMRRNIRDETESRTHVLRVTPPLEGKRTAEPYVSDDHAYYSPDLSAEPIHISAATLLVGHSSGSRHPDYRDDWSHPRLHTERSLFREEYDVYAEDGDTRELTDDEQAEWDEWWDVAMEVWESAVRHALESTETVTFSSHIPEVADTTVEVRVESEE